MSEPQTTTTPQEPLAYRPISGWAIAGCGAGGLFAVLVAASTIVGLFQGSPVFFPMWVVVLPALGILLSLLGQRDIQNSEGTRAGGKIANAGLWLSIVSGLTYFSYYFVTGLALQSQANDFLMEKGPDSGFFPLIKEGATNPAQLNAAFLLTKPKNLRRTDPSDEAMMRSLHDLGTKEGAPGPLTQFRDNLLVRVFYKHLAKDAEITPLTVQDWLYEKKSYKVVRVYRVKTIEVEMEMLMVAASAEGEPGQGRHWFVNMNESKANKTTKTFTPLGQSVAKLRAAAIDFAEAKIGAYNGGEGIPDVNQFDQTPWHLLNLDDKERDKLRDFSRKLLGSAQKTRIRQFSIFTNGEDPGNWEQVEGKIRFIIPVRLTLYLDGSTDFPVNTLAHLLVESRQAVDPAHPAAMPDWNMIGIEFTTVSLAIPEKK